MNKSRTLLRYHDLSIEVESSPSEELLDHMHQTVMGQPGGLQYHHTDLEDRMKSGMEDYFMYLRKSGKMLGSVGFCRKHSVTAGVSHDSWLIRYFSIKAPIKGIPRKKLTKADVKDENKRTTVLGRFIQPIFADPSQLREGETGTDQAAIIFAIIDQTNLRSMNFSAQMGLETVGTIAGFSFSRLQARKSDRIHQVEDDEKESILKQIREYYKDYTLFFSDSIFKNNDYYMIKEGERMVAGVQVYPVQWEILDFGSKAANRAMNILTRIPWVRKRISRDKISFLAMDAIYCETGYETALYELMEGVLEHTGHYIAMLMLDQKSDLYGIFRDRGKLGLVHKIMGTFHADIRVRFIHMPEKVRKRFFNSPIYIPTYDNS